MSSLFSEKLDLSKGGILQLRAAPLLHEVCDGEAIVHTEDDFDRVDPFDDANRATVPLMPTTDHGSADV